jgi:hypothetical protein
VATEAQLEELRRLVSEPDNEPPYTDQVLLDRIDAESDLRKLAGILWTEKAARYSELVNVQEGSSRRDLGKLHEQALSMAQHFGDDAASSTSFRRARTRPIVRP